MTGYQPGYCNIGRRQRRRRLRRGVVAFGGALAYVLASRFGVVPSALLVGVFVPLSLGFEWVIQAHTGFCVRLALLNRYDFTGPDADESAGTVTDATDRREDQSQAAKITAVAVVCAAVTTGVVVLLLG